MKDRDRADMGTLRVGDNPGIEVRLRRSAAARRLSLRVSQLDGAATLTMPRHLPMRQARAFLNERAAWLREAADKAQDLQMVDFGSVLPVEGDLLTVVRGTGRRVAISGDRLELPAHSARPARTAAVFLRQAARLRLNRASENYAQRLGKPFGRITLRDTRSRWGSCTSEGNLMYSWRLIMAPSVVLDYVVAHEVAHLDQMNHGPAFWATVARLCPDYDTHRQWLRDHGAGLHRWRFDD